MTHRTFSLLGLSLALLSGCASTSPKPAYQDVSGDVHSRSGHAVHWNQGGDDDKAAEAAVDALLKKELSVDAAVQISLLANQGMRARLEELAIAQADLVQAGLLKNPVFSFGRTAWEGEHLTPNLVATVEQDFLDVLTMPMRKRVAATALEATKLEVGDQILELASQVREAYYSALAAEHVLAVRRLVDDASKTSADLARSQHAAGNLSDLALSTELTLAAQASIDRRRSEGEANVQRERLNKVMGLWGRRTAWKLPGRLPDLPRDEPALEHLESLAVARRLDIAAARRNVQAMDYALSMAKTTRWTGVVNISVEAGRLRHNNRVSFGPSVALEIPLFDQRQAQIAKLEAFKRQGESQLEALSVDVRADVRSSRARVSTARGVVEEFGRVVVPLREQIVRLSQERYDAMLLGVYQLIQAKQGEFEAYRELIEAVRDYWIARSDLERAIGGRIAPSPAEPAARPVPPHHTH